MKTATINDVMNWGPCQPDEENEGYPRQRVINLFDGRERLSALDMLRLDIPAEDRMWAVLREDLIDARALHLLACDFAERAMSRIDNPDPRSIKAIEIKRLWVDGKATDGDLAAAWDAARTAAWDAARGAAWDAAKNAAGVAARAAAGAAARAAAWVAAGDAARAAAGGAAWDAAWAAAWVAAGDAARAAARTAAWAAAWAAAGDAEQQWQVEHVTKVLEASNADD